MAAETRESSAAMSLSLTGMRQTRNGCGDKQTWWPEQAIGFAFISNSERTGCNDTLGDLTSLSLDVFHVLSNDNMNNGQYLEITVNLHRLWQIGSTFNNPI